MVLGAISYVFLLIFICTLLCLFYELELIEIYNTHDNKRFSYSKIYGEMDGFDDKVDLLINDVSTDNSPSDIFELKIIVPSLDSIIAFDNMLIWDVSGKALHHQYYKTLHLRHFRRSLHIQIYVDNVLVPIPNNGILQHEELAAVLDFVSS